MLCMCFLKDGVVVAMHVFVTRQQLLCRRVYCLVMQSYIPLSFFT